MDAKGDDFQLHRPVETTILSFSTNGRFLSRPGSSVFRAISAGWNPPGSPAFCIGLCKQFIHSRVSPVKKGVGAIAQFEPVL